MTKYVPLHRSPQLPTGVNHFVRRCATRKDKLQGTGFWRYLGFLESVSPYSGVWLTLRLDTPGGWRMMRHLRQLCIRRRRAVESPAP